MVDYVLIYPNGKSQLVRLPDDAYLTFGPAIPFSKGSGTYTTATAGTYAVRVYSGKPKKSNLLAVFTGITEFRAASIQIVGDPVPIGGRAIEDNDITEQETFQKFRERLVGTAGFAPSVRGPSPQELAKALTSRIVQANLTAAEKLREQLYPVDSDDSSPVGGSA